MRPNALRNISLIAVTASYGTQIGAGIFALAMIGSVVSSAPPQSLAMLQGPYGYNSGAFWQVVPPITGLLFVLALIANWNTTRRLLLLGAFGIFVLGGIVTVGWLEPIFADVAAVGYRDAVEPALQQRASLWYKGDWAARCCDAIAGFMLLVALTRSPGSRV